MTKIRSSNLAKLTHLVKFLIETEKTLKLSLEKKAYTFIVDKRLKKPEIKAIFEKCFCVKIKKIKSLNIKKNALKKIYIFLKKNSVSFDTSFFHNFSNLICK